MERAIALFIDGIGAAAATSGVLTQLQGRGRSFAAETVQNLLRMVPVRKVARS